MFAGNYVYSGDPIYATHIFRGTLKECEAEAGEGEEKEREIREKERRSGRGRRGCESVSRWRGERKS